MSTLFLDCETTAKLGPDSHTVQLAALLTDDTNKVVGEMNVLVKPDGYAIPDEVVAIHGITTEQATKYGVPIKCAMFMFHCLAIRADTLVAHNIEFDIGMVKLEYARLKWEKPEQSPRLFCTMLNSKDILKLPGRYDDYKWPKLSEAYQHFFGESFDGAHDARNDLLACQRVYLRLLELRVELRAEAL